MNRLKLNVLQILLLPVGWAGFIFQIIADGFNTGRGWGSDFIARTIEEGVK